MKSSGPPVRGRRIWRSYRRRFLFVSVGALAVLVAVVAIGLSGESNSSAAAAALERAAQASQRGLAAPPLGGGQYWYVRSVQADTIGGPLLLRRHGQGPPVPVAGLVHRRQLVETWTSASAELCAGALPTDRSALLARIAAAATALMDQQPRAAQDFLAGEPLAWLELQFAGELLQSLPLASGARAAVYRALELVAGVGYLPHVRDPLGRPGVGLLTRGAARFRDASDGFAGLNAVSAELIFDPATGGVLAKSVSLISQYRLSASRPAIPCGARCMSCPRRSTRSISGWWLVLGVSRRGSHRLPLPAAAVSLRR
jgi:hypothetical protein